jgi:hydrogenase expression/formation protein HypE
LSEVIKLAHGFGGKLFQELLDNTINHSLHGTRKHATTLDAAVLELSGPIVFTTDSFTVNPRFFPGGNIGKLSVAGTVNDLAMMGAETGYLSLSLIIEEGFPLDELENILIAAGTACIDSGAEIVTGDTKVVEKGAIDGIFINTSGIGTRKYGPFGPDCIKEGDVIIISGTIGDHGASILNARENLGFSKKLSSDCAVLNVMISKAASILGNDLHALRDPTRGGLAAVLNEFAIDTGFQIEIMEESIPVSPETGSFLEILGMDPMHLANEGKVVLFVSPESAGKALEILRSDPKGHNAVKIGFVGKKTKPGRVIMETVIGTKRIVDMPIEAGLPRIC